ncbi:MAG: autotransporter domain-containing protein [Zoogloeaceae bacterium]|jgi:autotransporter-associated beta strand protein|nr:autotransporter domain-containing protein [Zoogloeaceae bacterium]
MTPSDISHFSSSSLSSLSSFSRLLACLFLGATVLAAPVQAANYDVGNAQTYATLEVLRNASIVWANGDTITIHGNDDSLTAEFDFGTANVTLAGQGVIEPVSSPLSILHRFAVTTGSVAFDGAGLTLEGFGVPDDATSGGAIRAHTVIISNGVNLFKSNKTMDSHDYPDNTLSIGGAIRADLIQIQGGTNTFDGNIADYSGGALWGGVIISGGTNTFRDNVATSAAAIRAINIHITGGVNTFTDNTAGGGGLGIAGAIYSDNDVTLIAKDGDMRFQGNTANGLPNAVHIANYGGSATLRLAAIAGRTIYFYDPIENRQLNPITIAINDESDGYGNTYDGVVLLDHYLSRIYGNTTVYKGALQLTDGATYGATDNAGGFTLKGPATLAVSGNTTINGSASSFLFENGATLATADGVTIANSLTLPATARIDGTLNVALPTSTQTLTLNAALTDNGGNAGSLVKTGAGTLVLTGINTYTGGTKIDAGELVFSQNGDQTLSGAISGTGNLTKAGAGVLTLSGANTAYSGATTVNAGTLVLAGSLPNSNVAINGNGSFDLRGTANNVTLASGASLNAYGGGSITGNLTAPAGSFLNFYLPAALTAGNTFLAVGGTANIDNSAVNVGIDGAYSPLQVGDSVTLIDAGTLSAAGINPAANGSGMLGVSLAYEFDLSASGNQLLATVRKAENNQRAKALSEGFAAGTAFLNQGADFIADKGFAALRARPETAGASLYGFAALGGGSLRHETGSHVDVDGYTLIAGLAAAHSTSAGDFTLGAFLEHGEGDYDTSNSFANAASVRGSGDADYTGGGILAHFNFNETQSGHFYTEASARFGKVSLDFSTRDLIDAFGRRAAFDSDSRYSSAHAGLGYVLKLNDVSTLRLYGQYLYSRQGSDTARLTTGEAVKFEAVDSHRARLGARWNRTVTSNGNLYLGAAWEHEYNGKAKASVYGHPLETPELAGDTGMLEAGFTLNPLTAKPLTLEIGLQGYTGKREGVTGSLRANYRF